MIKASNDSLFQVHDLNLKSCDILNKNTIIVFKRKLELLRNHKLRSNDIVDDYKKVLDSYKSNWKSIDNSTLFVNTIQIVYLLLSESEKYEVQKIVSNYWRSIRFNEHISLEFDSGLTGYLDAIFELRMVCKCEYLDEIIITIIDKLIISLIINNDYVDIIKWMGVKNGSCINENYSLNNHNTNKQRIKILKTFNKITGINMLNYSKEYLVNKTEKSNVFRMSLDEFREKYYSFHFNHSLSHSVSLPKDINKVRTHKEKHPAFVIERELYNMNYEYTHFENKITDELTKSFDDKFEFLSEKKNQNLQVKLRADIKFIGEKYFYSKHRSNLGSFTIEEENIVHVLYYDGNKASCMPLIGVDNLLIIIQNDKPLSIRDLLTDSLDIFGTRFTKNQIYDVIETYIKNDILIPNFDNN